MRFVKISFLSFLCVAVFPFTQIQAKCGVNSISTQRCEEGGWRTVVGCHDGTTRTMMVGVGSNECNSRRRYSVGRDVLRGFCENRCNPPILDCSETPSLDNLMNAICEKIVLCRPDLFTGPYACSEEEGCRDLHTDQMADCRIRLNSISASDELGLAESGGEITFSVIREALAAGTIRFDDAVYCDCIHRLRGPSGGAPTCPALGPSPEPFGEGLVEESIPQQCGNDAYPGVLIPDGFNPVTGEVEN